MKIHMLDISISIDDNEAGYVVEMDHVPQNNSILTIPFFSLEPYYKDYICANWKNLIEKTNYEDKEFSEDMMLTCVVYEINYTFNLDGSYLITLLVNFEFNN